MARSVVPMDKRLGQLESHTSLPGIRDEVYVAWLGSGLVPALAV